MSSNTNNMCPRMYHWIHSFCNILQTYLCSSLANGPSAVFLSLSLALSLLFNVSLSPSLPLSLSLSLSLSLPPSLSLSLYIILQLHTLQTKGRERNTTLCINACVAAIYMYICTIIVIYTEKLLRQLNPYYAGVP